MKLSRYILILMQITIHSFQLPIVTAFAHSNPPATRCKCSQNLLYWVVTAQFIRISTMNNNILYSIYVIYTSGSFKIISVIPFASSTAKSSLPPVGFSGYKCPDIHARTVYPSSCSAVRSISLQNG